MKLTRQTASVKSNVPDPRPPVMRNSGAASEDGRTREGSLRREGSLTFTRSRADELRGDISSAWGCCHGPVGRIRRAAYDAWVLSLQLAIRCACRAPLS